MIEPDKTITKGYYWREEYIKNHFPEFYQYLINNFPNDITWVEKLYWWKNNITEYPVCAVCSNRVSFNKSDKYYHKYCSLVCCGKGEDTKQKRINTSIKKYGEEHFTNRDKAKQTTLKKYGVENVSQIPLVIEKRKNKSLEKYGVTCTLHAPEIILKKEETFKKKYGVKNYVEILNLPQNIEENKKKILNKHRDNFLKDNPDVLWYNDDGSWEVKCNDCNCDLCKEKHFTIFSGTYWDRNKIGTVLCTKQNPLHSNQSGLEKFVKNILIEYNINFIERDRSILKNQEIDIFIPSKSIAIECNGCYWHDSDNKPIHYHEEKYLKCKEKGIQLISIWEDWIKLHPEIVKSLLLSKLGIYNERIYARKCDIKEIGDECIDFLNQNHIQGKTNASVKIGLFYQNNLIGVMTFSKRSKLSGGKNDNCWELTRFCTKLNTQVIGGADRLLKYFIRQYNPSSIVSFSSNDISNGNLYKKLGFMTDEKITNAYWYINQSNYIRYHRTSFTKSRLKQLGYDTENKTEFEIMNKLPFYKIYDSGHIKWKLNIN